MKRTNKIYMLGRKLGLNKKDINYALRHTATHIERSFSAGPFPYHGSYYGTVSIEDI